MEAGLLGLSRRRGGLDRWLGRRLGLLSAGSLSLRHLGLGLLLRMGHDLGLVTRHLGAGPRLFSLGLARGIVRLLLLACLSRGGLRACRLRLSALGLGGGLTGLGLIARGSISSGLRLPGLRASLSLGGLRLRPTARFRLSLLLSGQPSRLSLLSVLRLPRRVRLHLLATGGDDGVLLTRHRGLSRRVGLRLLLTRPHYSRLIGVLLSEPGLIGLSLLPAGEALIGLRVVAPSRVATPAVGISLILLAISILREAKAPPLIVALIATPAIVVARRGVATGDERPDRDRAQGGDIGGAIRALLVIGPGLGRRVLVVPGAPIGIPLLLDLPRTLLGDLGVPPRAPVRKGGGLMLLVFGGGVEVPGAGKVLSGPLGARLRFGVGDRSPLIVIDGGELTLVVGVGILRATNQVGLLRAGGIIIGAVAIRRMLGHPAGAVAGAPDPGSRPLIVDGVVGWAVGQSAVEGLRLVHPTIAISGRAVEGGGNGRGWGQHRRGEGRFDAGSREWQGRGGRGAGCYSSGHRLAARREAQGNEAGSEECAGAESRRSRHASRTLIKRGRS